MVLRTIYRCVFKANEDYSSLVHLDGGNNILATIFPEGVENTPSDLSPYQRKIDGFPASKYRRGDHNRTNR